MIYRYSIIRPKWLFAGVTLLLLQTGYGYAFELEDLFKRADQRAIKMLENGEAEAAANEFTDPQWRGVSRYRAGQYEEAMQDFSAAEDADGLYNHGTAAARAGDYEQAIKSLEQAQQLAPDDPKIANNLDIARKLKDLGQGQQQDQQQQDSEGQQSDEPDQQSGESEQQDEDSSEENGEQQGDSGEPGDTGQTDGQEQGESEESSDKTDAEQSEQSSEEQEQSAEELRDMMQQEQAAQQNESPEETDEQAEQQAAAAAPESLSEDDQATEQWLRRIPDDASQLLRNKIRLNHLIEYREVDDMQEPW